MKTVQQPYEIFSLLRKKSKMNQNDFPGVISRTSLSRYERGEQDITTRVLIRALQMMGTSFGEFMALCEAGYSMDYHTQNVPVFGWNNIEDPDFIPDSTVFYLKGANEKTFALRVRDHSMIGESFNYPLGAHIIVEPSKFSKIDKYQNGTFVVVKTGGTYQFRQIRNGYFVAANNDFESFSDGEIIGIAVGATWMI